jgi:Ser/Thr protein kinase RdoA (MazF antagonist)
VELLAEGRMAEVYVWAPGRALKLDRPEFNGVADFEADVLRRLAAAGLPVPAVFDTVVVDGRHGIVQEHLHGPLLGAVLRDHPDHVEGLADHFVDLQRRLWAARVEGLPSLADRVRDELGRSGLDAGLVAELRAVIDADEGSVGVCHYDLHPDNVVVTEHGWVVIDWLTAATGPTIADLARTLLLRGDATDPITVGFFRCVTAAWTDDGGTGAGRRVHPDQLDRWVRVVAGARLAEGFAGPYARWLTELARGDRRLGLA